MAAEEGFEPSHTESESAVLPLHHSATFIYYILSNQSMRVKNFYFGNKIFSPLIKINDNHICSATFWEDKNECRTKEKDN